MRLQKLELINFQAHEKVLVEFSPTITTIVGPTDSGKSAVLRALRWVCLNDLSGDEFIKEGEKRTTVTLAVDIGEKKRGLITQKIRRTKSVASIGHNAYELDENAYKSFAQGVPDDIAALLKLNEINFQAQHDSPFWFAETAGEVSRKLNAVVDLSVIDTALSNISAAVRRATERKDVTAERLNEIKAEFEQIKGQQDRITEFKVLKQAYDDTAQLTKDHGRLVTIIDQIRAGRNRLSAAGESTTALEAVFGAAREARQAVRAYQALAELITNVAAETKRSTPPPDFTPVEKTFVGWKEFNKRLHSLTSVLGLIRLANDNIACFTKSIEKKEAELHRLIKGKTCPLCQKPL